ncbi:adenosine deaminase [Alteromonas pelagimontana]|uniref:Adenine deaminase n=1 Tax=Alteromonas pelagimontana TaxID=1858656 RepID=A0A6M4MA47_9ALTE|nr:adenosine deaminase [Alteromonas pelagimontana]QJR79540.1 adenosine deaminase [Alteromonas pelagimontana]
MSLTQLIKNLPKAELHLHIEGSLEPRLLWELAQKHQVKLPYQNVREIEQAYQFSSLQSFLDIYYAGANVLRDEDDFYQLMWSYLCRCREENIVHSEIMFDPQTHTQRDVPFSVFMSGFERAIRRAEKEWGMSVLLIMSFLRHLSEADAIDTLLLAKPYYDKIHAIGLDSSELGHPPEKFERVFAKASALGFKLVAHAGEEGPSEYIWQAINLLNIDRIDHGVRCEEDDALLALVRERQIPLTVCPLSNLKLCVVDDINQHNILRLLDAGLLVTVNSDDPTYFGGYLNRNYEVLEASLGMNEKQLRELVTNSFKASFLEEGAKAHWVEKIAAA